ncbi:MAG: YibE/F family protein [Liquorilactobacillus hordei]|uniref:YibE/F family protein n=1 Tax=Liquorilactobacillus hordei TaxID=468911 RepID=UPI001CBD4A81|nr:YibE/F family protein [Liquorilactobacillus hordei]MBZ2406587.1 hypothetical protein [Liquorilactobacillus hordei]
MNTIVILIIVLALLMVLSGGKRGVSAFFTLIVNFGLLFLTVILIAGGFPPIFVMMFTGVTILAIIIYVGNNNETQTNTAFIATLLVLAVMLILIVPMNYLMQIYGFSNEQSEEIEAFNVAIGVNFASIAIATTILSTLGAIAEAAIAVASGMEEIIEQGAAKTVQELRTSGRNIGLQIMGMTFNTLFFGMFGGNLALFVLISKLDASFGYYANSKIFASETMLVIYAAISVVLVIWVTIEITVFKTNKMNIAKKP